MTGNMLKATPTTTGSICNLLNISNHGPVDSCCVSNPMIASFYLHTVLFGTKRG